jgi:hypothetical protein
MCVRCSSVHYTAGRVVWLHALRFTACVCYPARIGAAVSLYLASHPLVIVENLHILYSHLTPLFTLLYCTALLTTAAARV